MPRFKNGVYNAKCNDKKRRYLRISAGPQRGKYVHDLVLEAKIGRKLLPDETAEHVDGNGLNCSFDNLTGPICRSDNTRARHERERKNKEEK